MIKHGKILSVILITILSANIFFCINVNGCKDIVAVGDETDGDFNLLLKVRDPSRPGLQLLCIVPKGYEYSYHHPWTGKSMEFNTIHKFIGVATKGDIIPNIVKSGMALSDAGIAYGDADTGSNWRNPTRKAWDDFDWIRYACEKADNEDEAVVLMTEECVDELHASGVSENLFIVGPEKAFVIEADAFRYNIKEINDIVVMSNYPKELWRTQRRNALPIASSFEVEKEKYVRRGRTIRLNSLYGVRIVDIGEDWIVARQVPFIKIYNKGFRIVGNRVRIELGKRETVGDYSVELFDIDGRKAKVSVSYVFKAWEDEMLQHIKSRYGSISVKDMMKWSRLHEDDVKGLRPMCEDYFQYETVMIYKIPNEDYNTLSSGWFSANHACSSIFVPVHIAISDIYEPYKTGESAEISLQLLDIYKHGTLSDSFGLAEDVFLNETNEHEEIAVKLIKNNQDVEGLLTIVDTGIQEQAWLTELLWLEVGKNSNQDNRQKIIDTISSIWKDNYSASLDSMASAIDSLEDISNTKIINLIIDIALNICKSRLDAAQAIGKETSTLFDEYENGKILIEKQNYKTGFQSLINTFYKGDMLLKGESILITQNSNSNDNQNNMYITLISIILISGVILFILIKRKN